MDIGNADNPTQLEEMVDRAMMQINTAIPGIIQSFDTETITATVVPAIKKRTNIDGESSTIELPPLINVPVVCPVATTKGFAITLPVAAGDDCLLIFSQRSFENWLDLGGVQPPEDGVGSRHHHLTDAIAIMAPQSSSNVFSVWITDGIEIRNRNASMKATFKNDSIVFIVGSTEVTIDDSGMNVNNAFSSETSVEDPKGTMEEMRGVYNDHTHTDPQGGNTGPVSTEMT